MKREDRKRRLQNIIEARKKQEEKMLRKKKINEILELFPESVEILGEVESEKIENNMTACFQIERV
ncbi:hypothetical protein [Bacillus alkalicellulosilyticus]|uniref:hypothetical protein n=1 Tax=Alkalihalobacterium alkalicellulosilyticum TaxID=1912214 RepID=UPI000996B9A5|nr:hypothetical protein [Bacillus alkalicellulosilyticus]